MNSIEFERINREGYVSARIGLLNRAAGHLDWITPKVTNTSVNTEQSNAANTYFSPVAPSTPQITAEAPQTSLNHVDSLRNEIDSIYNQSPTSQANNRMGDY